MPNSNLSSPAVGMSLEELTNLMFQYYRELQYLLNGQLDTDNVREITTDKLVAGEALIGTALIETLVVGTNVGQGSAPIIFYAEPTTPYRVNDIWIDGSDLRRCSTARLTGAYNAADWSLGTNYQNPTGVTSIVGGVVTTDYVNALSVVAGSVAAENITGTKITGKTIVGGKFMNSAETHQLTLGEISGEDAIVFSESNGDIVFGAYSIDSVKMALVGRNPGGIILLNDGTFPGKTYIYGTWDFSTGGIANFPGYAHNHDDRYFTETESDSRYATASHDHGNTYVKTSQNIKIQYFSDHMEISNDGGATWKVIYYDA